jgi:hypothetical protein
MEGAGIMNLPTDVGGPTGQSGLDSYAPLIAAQSTARDMGYPRFTRELLSAGSEIDQAEVQEFLQEIRAADIQPEDVAVLRRVVEAVFNDPNNYPEVREQLLAEGVPEDILPETFDLEFFIALRMATEEVENLVREPRPTGQEMPMGMSPDMPVEMAEGGIVGLPQLTPIAREMAAMGRNGDTMLAHITPQEAMMLQRMGGSGTINPYTGLPEFFLKKLFRGVSKAFKSIGKAVKKFAKSTVGRVIISVALGAFLGPAAAGFLGASSTAAVAAVSGAVGGFGSSLLAGDDLKTALRSGITGAVLAGGTTALTGGSAALQARPELNVLYEQQGGFLGTVEKTAQNYFGAPVDTANQMYGSAPDSGGIKTAREFVTQPAASDATAQLGQGPQGLTGNEYFQGSGGAGFSTEEINKNILAKKVDPSLSDYSDQLAGPQSQAPVGPVTRGLRPNPAGAVTQGPVTQGPVTQGPVTQGPVTQGSRLTEPGTFERAYDTVSSYLSPTRESIQGRSADTIFKDLTLPKNEGGQFGFTSTPDTLKLATEMAAKEAPGMIAKYGPLAATGISALALTGNLPNPFEEPKQEPGESYEAYMARRDAAAAKFREERPEFFGSLAPTSYPTQTAQNIYTPPTDYSTRPNIPIRTYQAARGSGPEGVEDFPRKTGPILGPGTGTSDDIPAMLSDGEFVFTAKAVRNMGGGSRRKGAANMYKLMKMLEGGPVDKTAKA